MDLLPDHSTLATGLRMFSNVLTTVAAFAWLRFADVRDGQLDRPSIHHRIYLRVLIALSVTSVGAFLLSLILMVGAHRL